MANMKLKKGDNVIVIAGKDKGKAGKILVVDRKKNRVIVEGVNIVSKHTKPSPANQQGGIIKKENYIHASNVMYAIDGKPTKIGYKFTTVTKDGKEVTVKQRIAKKTGAVID